METLKLKRDTIYGKMTRFQNYLTEFGNNINITEIKLRAKMFENCYDAFDRVKTQIEQHGDDSEHDARDRFESEYFKTLTAAQEFINEYEQTTPVGSQSRTPVSELQVRLPVIQLPSFNGSYDQWLEFRDTFAAMIDDNASLSNIQKFHYLRSSLQGDALQVIHSLETSADNYCLAWKLIKERFENKKVIIQNYVNMLFDQQIISKESALQLRQFTDKLQRNIRALHSLGQPTDSWDVLIIHLGTSKLDNKTRREWEAHSSKTTDMPTLTEFFSFLNQRCLFLETIERTSSSAASYVAKPAKGINEFNRGPRTAKTQAYLATQKTVCVVCKKVHNIYTCEKFLNLTCKQRLQQAKDLNLCYNCLKNDHRISQCTAGHCRKCSRKHNTLLHDMYSETDTQNDKNEPQQSLSHCAHSTTSHVLLSTAIVEVFATNGKRVTCRVLLDSASQSNFITQRACELLKLRTKTISIPVRGINNTYSKVTSSTTVTLKSRLNSFKATLDCLIVKRITENLPAVNIDTTSLNLPKNILLADPNFRKSSPVDILIGAEIFFDLLCTGQVKTSRRGPTIQKTRLGWIVAGKVPTHHKPCQIYCNLTTNDALHDTIKKFWKIEEIGKRSHLSQEEQMCERHFVTTFTYNENGRYVVRLPFKQNSDNMTHTKDLAIKRLYAMEKRFNNNSKFKKQYTEFMQEYIDLGHMTELKEENNSTGCYLPHHGVIKEDSLTTKLRVVFDGSATSGVAHSLNDTLLKGAVIQDDLSEIILRFRTHNYVLTADIEKMYRQILMHDEDKKFQKILWHNHPTDEIKTYILNTVTYGTKTAPFLATRCLHQTALNCQRTHPKVSQIILTDFYVDDLLTGGQTEGEIKKIYNELTCVLNQNGFVLRKWRSNHIPFFKNTNERYMLPSDDSQTIKTLGLMWDPVTDTLNYAVKVQARARHTKRTVLSDIAQIFDPLGLIGPVTARAKILMQNLWQSKVDWDESLPLSLQTPWLDLRQNLNTLNTLTIARKITKHIVYKHIQLHGFSDASESAYGACIYIRTTDATGCHSTQLLCSKSRVAPLKQITIPRLELCAAHLLAQLFQKCCISLRIKFDKLYLWTDSTIVLHLLAAPANTWKVFVANRVADIQQMTEGVVWRHVRSNDNPADTLSRGQSPSQLTNNKLWWNGPWWLQENTEKWPKYHIATKDAFTSSELEQRQTIISLVTQNEELTFLEKYSSIHKLKRVMAYIRRFIHHTRTKSRPLNSNLSCLELDDALLHIIKLIQKQEFHEEISHLKKDQPVHNKSRLITLNPFLDSKTILRVGGRIKKAENIAYDQKHPILLPKGHHITKLLVINEHLQLQHAGQQLVLASLRTKFWPLSGRSTVRQVLNKCIVCKRIKPSVVNPIMGDLPQNRVTPARPFLKTAVDYAGPMLIRESRRRGRIVTSQCYIAVFICLTTKAVHLELVYGLTTDAFLAALKRFIARRGKCSDIYSDNATNFVKANKDLYNMRELFNSENHWKTVDNYMSNDGIQWHFIPPRAPHFGGLWEAAVKSAKYHLKRITGNVIFTYDEYYTLLIQIEACLNSRPLTPLSNDPNDLTPLTPAHFLIGESLTCTPEPYYNESTAPILSRWKHIQQVRQHFWQRWSKEYLGQLQQRSKWFKKTKTDVYAVGTLVLLKEDNLPPMQWRMGRIIETFPGDDGVVRVVLVKTKSGNVKRAVHKLCVLPVDIDV